MAFVVIYDACVLYPAPLRDLLIRLAQSGIVRARWSNQILDECFRSILEQRQDLKPDALARTRELMTDAVPDCMVSGHEKMIHPDDFVLDLLDLGPAAVANAVREQALALKRPPMTPAQVLDILRNNGLVQSVAKLRELYGDL